MYSEKTNFIAIIIITVSVFLSVSTWAFLETHARKNEAIIKAEIARVEDERRADRIEYINSVTQPQILAREDGSITYIIPAKSETFGDVVFKYNFNSDGDYFLDAREVISSDKTWTEDYSVSNSALRYRLKALMERYPISIPVQ